jgi:hypothetical protein
MQWPGLIRASVSTRRRLWHGQLRVAVGGHLATTTVGADRDGILLATIQPRSRPESRDSYPTSEVARRFVAARAGSAACDTDPRLSLGVIQRACVHSRVATRCK